MVVHPACVTIAPLFRVSPAVRSFAVLPGSKFGAAPVLHYSTPGCHEEDRGQRDTVGVMRSPAACSCRELPFLGRKGSRVRS